MSIVIVVNGPPRAGKDTLIGFMRDWFGAQGMKTAAFSSIDPVKELLTDAGFNLTAKTSADRKLLADVGVALEEHSHFRSERCVRYWVANTPDVLFLHIREPHAIERVREKFRAKGVMNFHTVLLTSNRSECHVNQADSVVFDMNYDFILTNDGAESLLDSFACELSHLISERQE